MQREARITSKRRVTIPRDIGRALWVREGDILVFEADDKGSVAGCRSQRASSRSMREPGGRAKENRPQR